MEVETFRHPRLNVYQKNKSISNLLLSPEFSLRGVMEIYLSNVCEQLVIIHKHLGLEISDAKAYQTRPVQGGRVLPKFLQYIPMHGNFREKMCFINDVAIGNQAFLWKIIEASVKQTLPTELTSFLNMNVIKKRLERIHTTTGINNVVELIAFHKANPTATMPNFLVNLHVDGPVLLSRYNEFPLKPVVRTLRPDADRVLYTMRMREANPPLSLHEKEYIATTFQDKYPNGFDERRDVVLPWITGAMVWDINRDSFYAKIAQHYGQELIAGPSGSSEACLEVFELFQDFNIDIAAMCCAAWLCNRNDHSLWEVLLAAIPFGLDYSTEDDAYESVEKWLRPRYP